MWAYETFNDEFWVPDPVLYLRTELIKYNLQIIHKIDKLN